MTQVKFYRVETLPEVGEVGSLYFVHKDESPKLYVYTSDGFEQYSDLFYRDFSTLSVDALANAGNGVVYFTPDTHLIIKDGVVYGYENLTGYATEQWVEEQGYIKSIPPHTVTINFYNDIDYAVWHNMVGDIEITSMQSTNVLDLYVSDGNNLNKQDVEIALDNGPISITNGSTLTFDVIKTTDANGFAAVTLTYNIK